MDDQAIQFGPCSKARFVERPNRFLVRCDVDGLGIQEAFLPNPGRLWELLFPGVTLYVTGEGDRASSPSSNRKTKYTVLAVERDGHPIFVHTHLTNAVARFLIERKLIPELADAEVVRAEYPVGNSRFDFLLRDGRRQIYLEVKSCTLYGNGVAMFPDAVTERGRRHLVELASLRSRTIRPCVLFLIHTPEVQWFMPDYHTDLDFSRTLLDVRHKLDIHPIAVQWHSDLSLGSQVRRIEIPWKYLRREVEDRGSYLLVLRVDKERRVRIGGLGTFSFRRGYYVYVGSAMRNLQSRLARHSRRRKTRHWHVDYLRQVTSGPIALPIRSSLRQECEVARAFADILEPGPAGFGSSDCKCATHLFRHETNPLELPPFHTVLQQFRMRWPD
jgi:sugar fermentation stimulation protein A